MMNLAKNFLLGYLLLKPFYLFSSGGLQAADGFLLAAFSLFLFTTWFTPEHRKQLGNVLQQHRLLIVFVVLTFVVNGLWFAVYPEFKFLLSSLYFVFNLLAIIVFTAFFKDKVFLSRVGSVFKFNMLLQLGLWVMQIGRFYSPDRYMGTFNDPNQFGYYVFLSFLFVYIIDAILKNKHTYAYYILAFLLIILSGSTGMLLGMGVFSILAAVNFIRIQLISPYKMLQRIMYSLAIVAILFLPLSIIGMSISANIQNAATPLINNTLLERVDEKAEKASGDANISIFQDRNLDNISEYPFYVIWGSGEGAFGRFEKATYPGSEIHSTLPAILFYYGALPTLVLLLWIYRQIQGAGIAVVVALVPLFVASFMLLNQRQAMFWVLIVLAGLPIMSTAANQKKKEIQ